MIEYPTTATSAARKNDEVSNPNERTSAEVKTIFNILSKIKDSDATFHNDRLKNSETKENAQFVTTETIHINTLQRNVSVGSDETDDIVILRRDPETKRASINKRAYAKLHRSLSPDRSNTVDRLKEKYEGNSSENENQPEVLARLDPQTIETLKKKYSPAGLGYTKQNIKHVKPVPVPKPRLAKSQVFNSPPREGGNQRTRYSLNIDKNTKNKDENSNLVQKSRSNSDEFITVVKRSDSEESVDKFQKELSFFTMDKKKRSSSFRKLFSGKLFGKDKKKKGEEKNKSENKENGTFSENMQNENKNFNRHSSYRHTTDTNNTPHNSDVANLRRSDSDNQLINYNRHQQLEKEYAQKHINQFKNIKHSFEHTARTPDEQVPQGYVPMEKPIFKSNHTTQSPTRYMNLQSVQKYIDTSSSGSTSEPDRINLYQNEVFAKNNSRPGRDDIDFRREVKRDTPPRAQETRQHVKLVSPKALIPINSERPLPNPYHNTDQSPVDQGRTIPKVNFSNLARIHNEQKELERKLQQPYLNETYGTVFDNVELRRPLKQPLARSSPLSDSQRPPRSPSLEATKLRLPPNRDIVPLSPRVKSPIPHHHVSTEKLIATELLKPSRSPTPIRKHQREPSPSHQRLEINIDYPGPTEREINENLVRKPPLGNRVAQQKTPEECINYNNRMSQDSIASLDKYGPTKRISQGSLLDSADRTPTGSTAHVSSPNFRTPTPNSVLHNRSLSPVRVPNVRPVTPINSQIPQSPSTTPQKEEMRKSVEAYYWKEIKKLKDQENFDYYIYQMQNNMIPYGFVEEPISVRRSRSMSPTAQRNGRRSLSLPRESRPTNVIRDIPETRYQAAIPEGRALTNQMQPASPLYVQTQFAQNFVRNAPQRSTIDGGSRNSDTNSLYRPIFKRGSLNAPTRQIEDSQLKRQVSFSNNPNRRGEQLQSWPTRNGFTASPPQRRMDKPRSVLEDDVFLPDTPTQTYGYVNVHPTSNSTNPNEIIYYTRRNNEMIPTSPPEVLYGQPLDAIRSPQGLSRHGSIQINEELYKQRQLQIANQQNNILRQQQEPQYVTRQMISRPPLLQKREIIINDEIFGQFGGYVPVNNDKRYVQNYQQQQQQNPMYASRQSVAESVYGPRQVLVHNKVCDIYGKIHDSDTSPQKIQKSGVVMGQLYKNPGSPPVARQSYAQLPPNNNEQFVRNSRLTASANDMYRRMQNDPRYVATVRQVPTSSYPPVQMIDNRDIGPAPTRPLPPVPAKGGNRKENLRANVVGVSDTESGSDASEIQRILNNSGKNKKRGLFGK